MFSLQHLPTISIKKCVAEISSRVHKQTHIHTPIETDQQWDALVLCLPKRNGAVAVAVVVVVALAATVVVAVSTAAIPAVDAYFICCCWRHYCFCDTRRERRFSL